MSLIWFSVRHETSANRARLQGYDVSKEYHRSYAKFCSFHSLLEYVDWHFHVGKWIKVVLSFMRKKTKAQRFPLKSFKCSPPCLRCICVCLFPRKSFWTSSYSSNEIFHRSIRWIICSDSFFSFPLFSVVVEARSISFTASVLHRSFHRVQDCPGDVPKERISGSCCSARPTWYRFRTKNYLNQYLKFSKNSDTSRSNDLTSVHDRWIRKSDSRFGEFCDIVTLNLGHRLHRRYSMTSPIR